MPINCSAASGLNLIISPLRFRRDEQAVGPWRNRQQGCATNCTFPGGRARGSGAGDAETRNGPVLGDRCGGGADACRCSDLRLVVRRQRHGNSLCDDARDDGPDRPQRQRNRHGQPRTDDHRRDLCIRRHPGTELRLQYAGQTRTVLRQDRSAPVSEHRRSGQRRISPSRKRSWRRTRHR